MRRLIFPGYLRCLPMANDDVFPVPCLRPVNRCSGPPPLGWVSFLVFLRVLLKLQHLLELRWVDNDTLHGAALCTSLFKRALVPPKTRCPLRFSSLMLFWLGWLLRLPVRCTGFLLWCFSWLILGSCHCFRSTTRDVGDAMPLPLVGRRWP
jgi:hypothetical protein